MANPITDSIAVWTAAQIPKSNGGRGNGNGSANRNAYGIKKLRELILELAVRGKLVPQDPTDEPASVLLEKIAKEKARMVKERKIRKQDTLPDVGEEEKPFELPEGWEWVRLGNIFDIQDYRRVPLSSAERANREGPYPYYGANGQVGVIDDYLFEGERILVAEDGGFFNDPIRGVAYIAKGKFWVNNHAHVLECLGGTCAKFWVSFFNRMNWAPLVRGMTRDKLNQAVMAEISLPSPPLAEQHRIVAKVDELMALCDRLEEQQNESSVAHQTLVETLLATLTATANQGEFADAWQRIADHFVTLFTTDHSIDQLKQTILQLAVMGKLVPQDSNDEPASVLLKKIAAEKARLVKEGKIKKQARPADVSRQERPFQLPQGWTWASLEELGIFSGGKTPSKARSNYWSGHIPWVTPKDMKVSEVFDTEDHVTPLAISDGLAPCDVETLLFVVRSGILRRTFPVAIAKVPCTINQDLKALSLYLKEMAQYVLLMMRGFEEYILKNLTKTGMTVESVMFDEFSNNCFMIPPLAEQHRIVAKVDELMTLCDGLKARLKEAQVTQVQLADAVVEQAVA